MTFDVVNTAPVTLALPAWAPGDYTLRWFSRNVSSFAATESSAQLTWHKLDYQTWEIVPNGAGKVSVTFDYLANSKDRAVAWTSSSFAFFNGSNVFMYPKGRGADWPATVTVETDPSWRVATGMAPTDTARTYAATNYHDLVDMPFWIGRFDLDSTQVVGRWIRLATYPTGMLTLVRRDRAFNWLQRLVPPEAAVFRDVPFRNYTIFLLADTVVNGGGLEHQSSQMDEMPLQFADSPLLSYLFSHEFFHAWNVKRLRPADMVPYRYAGPDPTKWLWVSEGVTDYYAQLALVRGGIIDSTGFTDAMTQNILMTDEAPSTSLSDASLSAWAHPTDGTVDIYYPKGAVAGFLLDIMIRNASNNSRSLDDVMRTLYDDTYKRGKGFTASDWWSAVSHAAGGRSFDEFARRYVDGREPLPFDSVLPLAGLRLVRDTIWVPDLGIQRTTPDSGGVRVILVTSHGAAEAAGLRQGDLVTSIGGIPMRDSDPMAALRGLYVGKETATLSVIIERGNQRMTFNVPARFTPQPQEKIEFVRTASTKEIQIRNGILRGRTTAGAGN